MSEHAGREIFAACPQCGATQLIEHGRIHDDLECPGCSARFRIRREKRRHRRPRTDWSAAAGGPGAIEHTHSGKRFTTGLIAVAVLIGLTLLVLLLTETGVWQYLANLIGRHAR
jgi:hypothetical protein